MKKLKIFIMSIFMLTLGTVLMACDFKKPEATFDKKEIVISINDSISLDEYLSVKKVEKKSITYKLENPDLFDFDGKTLTAVKSGKSYVHATYKKNVLASMQIVVRTQFTSPTFSDSPLSSDGVFSWNPVYSYFNGQVVSANEYKVEGFCTVYSATDPSVVTDTVQINETVASTSYALSRSGVYKLTVTALGTGYFADSNPSQPVTLHYGYMQAPTNFAWDEQKGELSWDGADNSNYAIKFDGVELAQRQTVNSISLFERLSASSAGAHTVSVVAYDQKGMLLATESETVTINKLATANAQYVYDSTNGGRVKIVTDANATSYRFDFVDASNSANKASIFVSNDAEQIFETFEDVDAGLYNVKVVALPKTETGFFFQSEELELGKIYKLPTAHIEGAGGNTVDRTSFGMNLSSQANPVDVLLSVDVAGVKTSVEGFEAGNENFNFEIALTQSGSHTISLKQIPVSAQNTISGQNVLVINSNASNSIVATKVDTISGNVVHSYVDGKSVLTFSKTEFATSYTLQTRGESEFVDVESEKYNVSIGEETVAITLVGKLEDLVEPYQIGGKSVFDLRIVAKTEDDTLSIGSSKTKRIEVLDVPQTANAGNSTKKEFSWASVAGAGSYKVELFEIDKTVYEQNKDAEQINIDTTGLVDLGGVVEETSIDVTKVGYYYAKVYSLSLDADKNIASQNALEEVFYICEKLEVEDVKFADNGSNYYISIKNAENISSYEVFLNDVSLGTPEIAQGDSTEFLISDKFETAGQEYTISVVAHSDNEQLYNESDAFEFVVERLPKVAREDIQIGELTLQVDTTDLSANSISQELSISAVAGAKGVRIWDGNGTTAGSENETVAKLSISNQSNVEYNFRYYGSAQKDSVFAMESGKVYLSGEISTYRFTRLQTPTELSYYDGALRFEHTATTSTAYYVLTIVCVGLNGKEENITVKLARNTTACYQDIEENIGSDSEFVSINANVVTIDFENIIEQIQSIGKIANVYNQSDKVGFAVYAEQDRLEGGIVTISSNFATTSLDNSKVVCVVEKMPETILEIDLETSDTDYILKWSAAASNASYESETRYQVLLDGVEVGDEISALTKSFARTDFDVSTYYEFSVVVTNPYYVQSDSSNIIRIYKLGAISQLKLFETAQLGYEISSIEKDFVDYVKVVTASSFDNNKTGKVDITENGRYTLKVVGKKAVESEGNKKTYYVDSEESSWTVSQMSALKPADESVTYQNNTISWNEFASSQNLHCLRYILMFVDENGNTARYKTASTSENLTTNKELYNALNALSGEVTIYVSAYLETFPIVDDLTDKPTYSVAAGGTVYYSKAVELPLQAGMTENNHYLYSGTATVNKFATPNIKNVEFVADDLANAQLPDVKIVFEGNYGTSRNFDIFLNGEFYRTENITLADGKYSFVLSPVDYNSKVDIGETLTVGVCALSDTDILSSIASVEIVRVKQVEEIEFVEDSQLGFTHKLKIKLPAETQTSGGVVVKVTYQETGDALKDEYVLVPVNEVLTEIEYDLTETLSKTESGKRILAKGGKVKLSAFVASVSSANKYSLACSVWTESDEYQILATVEEVEKTSGGFVIDADTNSTLTTYIVECNNTTFEVTYENGKFYFEFPHGGQWANGTYTLTVYAKEDGKLRAIATEIDFVLNKLTPLSDVMIQRDADDLSAITLSWDSVSGATGYVFRMYEAGDETRANLIYEYVEERTNGSSTIVNSCTLTDMFGEGFVKLLEGGKVDIFTLMSDKNFVFDVFVRGSEGVNDSDTFTFNATIKGNSLEVQNFEVNAFGNIVFNCTAGETYLYRFTTSDGTVLQNWTKLYAESDSVKIDTSKLTAQGGTYYNMEVTVVGNNIADEISTKQDGLVVDSITFTTRGTDRTFVVGTDIVEVGYIESEGNTDLSFELVIGTYTRIYVGLSEDALLNEQVVSIIPLHIAQGSTNEQEICTYKLPTIIDKLKELGQTISANNQDIDLYFWACKDIDESDLQNCYTISHSSSCSFTYENKIDFIGIRKLGKELAEDSKFIEDYANSFALFENNDISENKTTFGIYVKISPLEAGNEDISPVVMFVDRQTLLSGDYFLDEDCFEINLTKLFEESEFADLYGKFSFEFSVLSVKALDGEKQFVLSDWIGSDNGKQFVFNKLRDIDRLDLMSGSLTWTNIDENAQKYYVYFIESVNDNLQIGDTYVYDVANTNRYNASEFIGLEKGYYLAVRSVNEDAYVLPSQLQFVMSEGKPVKIEKNEIKAPLKIENGKVFIEFAEGEDETLKLSSGDGRDFVDYIRNCGESTEAVNTLLNTTFKVPFTFKLSDLVYGRIFVRLRFTSLANSVEGRSQTFDVDARYLISSLFALDDGYDYKAKLGILENRGGGATLRAFSALMEDGSFGVGNYKTLFDDRFESLQTGEYKLDYCLLGNSSSLTSAWYSFKNNGENSIYVNNEPTVQAIKTSAVDGYNSANSYKVILKKSEIYSKQDGVLTSEIAKNYILKIYNDANEYYAFSISKISTAYSLTLFNGKDGVSVSVYETDEFGKETVDGDYLMFYINQNEGNSILGRYGMEIKKGAYKMQIFATGNDYSFSSKSALFNLTLYGFKDDFSLNNGEFSWTPQKNVKTTVIYKKHSSVSETIAEPIETTSNTARYSLDEAGYGLYDYVDFLVVGDVYANNIFVDSEVYHIENVYKLMTPSVSNVNGLIQIDDTNNKEFEGLDGCYSDLDLYNYKVYNDVSSESIQFIDSNNAEKPIYYEVGVTDLSQNAPEYNYKYSEYSASKFYIASLGTTATFEIENNNDPTRYYLKNVKYPNTVEGDSDKMLGVALRSNFEEFDAKMLDTASGLSIRDGVLTWNSVEGRTEGNLTISNREKIVYKVTVVQYDLSYVDDGESENEYANKLEYYTLETKFDFARIPEEKLNKSAKFMKATVQAFAMNVSNVIPAFPTYLNLVEGGYAYGNVKFAGTDSFVLMGNGETIKSIERCQSIDEDSLAVVDGGLTWTVTFDSATSATENFGETYKFSVVDENFKEIEGDFTFEQGMTDRQVVVKFSESKGQLSAKTQALTVYMTKVSTQNSVIKSFGKEIEITKLKAIDSNDFVISSNERDSNIEILDFTNYFESNASNVIELSIYQNDDKTDTPTKFVFNATKSKLYILEQEDEAITADNEYVGKFVVGQNSRTIMNFNVKNLSLENCLYSDVSDDLILQRSSWGDGRITWNSQAQRFEWSYNGFNALQQKHQVTKIEQIIETSKETVLYQDRDLEIGTIVGDEQLKLAEGTEIVVENIYENSSEISYEGNTYFISNSDYRDAIKAVETTTLSAGTLFKIVDAGSGTESIIQTEDGALYTIAKESIVKPVYIVEATYGEGASAIVRTYTTTKNYFTPTIIGKVAIKVKIKLGEANIQSQALEYNNGQTVNYNLFAAGQGTAQSPYLISTETQFKNILHRLSKDESLKRFTENGNIKNEEEKYYFSLQRDIVLSSELQGILFDGVFTGEIRGNGYTIEYVNSTVSKLSNGDVTVSEGNVVSSTDADSTVISYGAALFETLSSTAVVKDLNLKVTLSAGSSTPYVTRNSLISGLAITNSGKIENVNLTGLRTNFVGIGSNRTRIMMIYSGIASINIGRDAVITNCSANTNMEFNDLNTAQLIFFGGIAFTNYASIENCTAGDATSAKTISVVGLSESDVVQVAGIVVTNAGYSKLAGCKNYANITVSAQYDNDNFVVYIAGVTALANGTVQNNQNNGKITATNILDKNLHKGNIYPNDEY